MKHVSTRAVGVLFGVSLSLAGICRSLGATDEKTVRSGLLARAVALQRVACEYTYAQTYDMSQPPVREGHGVAEPLPKAHLSYVEVYDVHFVRINGDFWYRRVLSPDAIRDARENGRSAVAFQEVLATAGCVQYMERRVDGPQVMGLITAEVVTALPNPVAVAMALRVNENAGNAWLTHEDFQKGELAPVDAGCWRWTTTDSRGQNHWFTVDPAKGFAAIDYRFGKIIGDTGAEERLHADMWRVEGGLFIPMALRRATRFPDQGGIRTPFDCKVEVKSFRCGAAVERLPELKWPRNAFVQDMRSGCGFKVPDNDMVLTPEWLAAEIERQMAHREAMREAARSRADQAHQKREP